MIEQPTVLILGAGASMPYDFPSGLQLMQIIINEINPESPGDLLRALFRYDFKPDEIDDFCFCLSRSQKYSVDEFLEHRHEFEKIGKIAITLRLVKYENENKLFDPKNDKNWYRYLWNKISDVPFEEFGNNQLSIITFNYDRSIEHYLINAMKSLYRKDEKECAKKIMEIPIIHVHGRLGALPCQDKNGRLYHPSIIPDEVERISKQIKEITEQKEPSKEFEEAHKILSSSQKICFLGFGYHPVNIRRLKIKEVIDSNPRRAVWGTSLNFGDAERRNITHSWGISVVPSHNEILEFLKNNFILD